MVTRAQAAKIALALPESVEQDHHGRISFRVAGRIFATLWDEHHTNVMLDAEEIRAATEANPGMCEEFWVGAAVGGRPGRFAPRRTGPDRRSLRRRLGAQGAGATGEPPVKET